MRKMLLGLSAAVLMAAMIALFGTTASAANAKNCWAHSLDGVNYSAVWATGGGHGVAPHIDTLLGTPTTAEGCQTLFDLF
jgi:hypothetical protein